ncbi:MAG: tetratricopeptide repeat protein [Candidatus Omnitrophica bacterium]|nr:tetratricopeptide repeat protein [Candidatus Omnitrophota bacterium]MCM8793381.1 tetratricopeptide repeat protein [Candidatus Omnitrophota bacterium]
MKKIIYWGIGLLIILEVLVPNIDWINYKVFLAYTIVGLLLFIGAIGYLIKENFYKKTSLDLPLILYFSLIFISYILSPFKSASGYSFLNTSVLIILYFLLVSSLKKKEEINYLFNLWIFSSLMLCLYSFLYQVEFVGSFGNPNLFASFLVSLLPISLVRFYQVEDKEEKFLFFVSTFVFLLTLFLTKSRAGMGAGLFSLLLFFYLGFYREIIGNKNNLKRFFQILIMAIIGGLIFFRQILSFFALKDRIYIWQGALRLIKENWLFGWGVGNFPIYFPKFSPQPLRQIYPDQFVNNAHNEFLTLTAELGIIGLVLFLWILGIIFLMLKRSLKSRDIFVRQISLGLLSSLSGILLINLFDVSLRFLFTAIFFWFLTAILGSLEKMGGVGFSQKNFLPKRIIVFPIFVILSMALFKQAFYGFEMSREYDKTVRQLKINLGEIEKIKRTAEEMVSQNKADAQIYFKLGTIYAKMMDWQKAKAYLEKAINLDAKIIFAYTNLGNVYAEINDLDKALDCYRKAIGISPDYLNAHYNLGFIYFKKGEIEKALQEFDFVLSKNKNDFYAWQMRQLIFE